MTELMIIVDDFTGALGVRVHFVERGIGTRVTVGLDYDRSWEGGIRSGKTTVLVTGAEARHMSPDQAYRKVFVVAKDAREVGIPYIYRKMDSALRGSIGSELEAAYRAADEPSLSFVLALSQTNRTTRGDRQHIDGVPVSKSMFGRDPFEPVTKDSVKDTTRLQSEIPVIETHGEARSGPGQAGIMVYDVTTETGIRRIGADLTVTGQNRLMAGCMGFAAILSNLLDLERQESKTAALECRLFVIYDSVSPITRRQLDWGERVGYPRIYMTVKKGLNPKFWRSEQGAGLTRRMTQESNENDCVILDTNDHESEQSTLEYARELGMDTGQVHSRIPETLGIILKSILDCGPRATILVIGGDTLLGFMKEIRQWELQPIRQVWPGCVLIKLYYYGREHYIITKSGGFGEENLLSELTEELKGEWSEGRRKWDIRLKFHPACTRVWEISRKLGRS